MRGTWIAMESTGSYALVPLATLALLVLAVGTDRGPLQHYWVVIPRVLTVDSWAVLLLHMPTVSAAADPASSIRDDEVARLGGDVVHPRCRPGGPHRHHGAKRLQAARSDPVVAGRVAPGRSSIRTVSSLP